MTWAGFKALVDGIGAMIGRPLDDGAAEIFSSADALVAADTYRLAFWLTHVGEALSRV